ncbi:Protein of uncharacterised function (DUF3757) [Yersinia thracica]|uniref:Protein of uncharacterized function (DUF3757) n=1 Tax=Yersinia thracica TaxID=2890319 RepID=A0A0T9Q494_9GAMM|nr:DUF3757 domain-containing protein [Yersinia thracica]CNH94993.1 Protein of uncharacterised function (DUF3757) [Yersinia thracica]
MKYKSPVLWLLCAPLSAVAQHCPAINTIQQIGLFYSAETGGDEKWIGSLQGSIPQNKTAIKDFSEALLIIDSENEEGNSVHQGKFQKCTYNLQAEGWQLDMYYGNKTWPASISGKPHWQYQQTAFLEIYHCSEVAAEECQFDILPSESAS